MKIDWNLFFKKMGIFWLSSSISAWFFWLLFYLLTKHLAPISLAWAIFCTLGLGYNLWKSRILKP